MRHPPPPQLLETRRCSFWHPQIAWALCVQSPKGLKQTAPRQPKVGKERAIGGSKPRSLLPNLGRRYGGGNAENQAPPPAPLWMGQKGSTSRGAFPTRMQRTLNDFRLHAAKQGHLRTLLNPPAMGDTNLSCKGLLKFPFRTTKHHLVTHSLTASCHQPPSPPSPFRSAPHLLLAETRQTFLLTWNSQEGSLMKMAQIYPPSSASMATWESVCPNNVPVFLTRESF